MFNLDRFKNIKNPLGAVLSYYLKNQDNTSAYLYSELLPKHYNRGFIEFNNDEPLDSVLSGASASNIWYHFNIPANTIGGLVDGTLNNNGFYLYTKLDGHEYEKRFVSKRSVGMENEIPKLGLIFDEPAGITVLLPNNGVVLRPTLSYPIVWHSNVTTGSYKIELLKSGTVVDVIADNCTDSYFDWVVDKSAYTPDTDYSIQISSGSIVSTDNPQFEILEHLTHLTVTSGNGTGFYNLSDTVQVSGVNPDTNKYCFGKWSGDTASINDPRSDTSFVVIGASDIEIEAKWEKHVTIPGDFVAGAYYKNHGRVFSSGVYLSFGVNIPTEEFYVEYNVTVAKSGMYYTDVSARLPHSSRFDSISVLITDIATDDTLLRGPISKDLVFDPSSMIYTGRVLDTGYIAQGEYKVRMKWFADPFFYYLNGNENSVLYDTRIYSFNFFVVDDQTSIFSNNNQSLTNQYNFEVKALNNILYMENSNLVKNQLQKIIIYDVNGKIIKTFTQAAKRKQEIVVDFLSNGVYIITAEYHNRVISKKITLFR